MLERKTICPYDCPTTCTLLVQTDGRRILKVAGDPDDPVTHGVICRKMQRYEKSVHAPRRILTPLKRTGPKGQGEFTPISWDEAVDTITGQWKRALAETGPDSILPFYYSGVMSHIHRKGGDALFNKMGACSLVMTLCSSAKSAGYAAVMGKTGCLDPRELAESDLYLVWGSNMKATRLHSLPDIQAGRKNGRRVILIESYAGDMPGSCDQTVLVRPGTDGALALALMHVLDREGLTDREFLSRESVGFAEFQATLGQYTPAWAEGITGVPARVIEELAREYGAAKAPAIILGSGNSRYGNGGMTVRLITILSACTGAWTRPGGGLCGCATGAGPFVDAARITHPELRTHQARKVNINRLSPVLAGEPGQAKVRCLHVYACNPVASVHDQLGIQRGLTRPDLFTVVHERFLTDTARYADIILPATFSVEQSDVHTSYGYRSFGASWQVIPPPGECRSNWDIFRLLARGMGYAEECFERTDSDIVQELLEHPLAGLRDISEAQRLTLRQGGMIAQGFAAHTDWQTPSGKMEIVNTALASPLPGYQEGHGGEYPLRLIAVPSDKTLNSIFLERGELVARRGVMTLAVHPEDAAARGIADQDAIVALNDLGEVAFTARVTPLVARGAVAAVGVFAAGQSGNGHLVNALHHPRISDIGEATTMNDNTVEVRKA